MKPESVVAVSGTDAVYRSTPALDSLHVGRQLLAKRVGDRGTNAASRLHGVAKGLDGYVVRVEGIGAEELDLVLQRIGNEARRMINLCFKDISAGETKSEFCVDGRGQQAEGHYIGSDGV